MSDPSCPISACQLEPASLPVCDMLVLFCEKCGAKMASDSMENPSKILQKSLKEQIKHEGRQKERRAILSSCLNLCPENKIALGLLDLRNKKQPQFLTLSYSSHQEAHKAVLHSIEDFLA
jgi:hypothetical protein